jgi:hypothetical protein
MSGRVLKPIQAVVFFCLLGLVFSGCGMGGGKVVATVNKVSITLDEFQQQCLALQSMRPGMTLDDATRRQILEQMVKQELLAQQAGQMGLDQKPEIQQEISQKRQQFHQELEAKIESAKQQMKHLDKDIRNNVLIEELIGLKANQDLVSEVEAKNYYQNLKKQNANLPPYPQVASRIHQQLLLEKLVSQAKEKADVTLHTELLAAAGPAAGLDDLQKMPLPQSQLSPAPAPKP